MAPDWPYEKVPRALTASIIGREYYIRACPKVEVSELIPNDFFHDL